MIKLSYNHLRLAVIIYLVVPIMIFLFGWLSVLPAILFAILIIGGVFFLVKSTKENDGNINSIDISVKAVVVLGIIALLWCLLAGQGGLIHQSSDHIIRNQIFRDLIKLSWPVVYSDDSMLSYYITHWMVPAVAGKAAIALSGSVYTGYLIGNIVLVIWSSIGTFLTLLLTVLVTSPKGKSLPIIASVMFIMFSGLDFLGTLINGSNNYMHLEWWFTYAQFSSVTTCLFWVYNQALVSWLITMCLINEKSTKNFAILGILIFPFGPFPFVGAVIICIVRAIFFIVKEVKESKLFAAIKETCSFQNIVGLIGVAVPYALYYISNAVVANDAVYDDVKQNVGLRFHSVLAEAITQGEIGSTALFIAKYLLFLLLEAGIYVILIAIYNKQKKQKQIDFFVATAFLAVIPLFQIGIGYDISMRVSIPIIVWIAIEFIKMVTESIPPKEKTRDINSLVSSNPLLAVSVLVFVLGALTPLTEYRREIGNTIVTGVEEQNDYFKFESLEGLEEKNNFTSPDYENSLFYKYLCS